MSAEPAERTRVLVVDDEPQMRKLLSVSLERQGYRVEVATGGEEAFERLGSGQFEMLLLDLGLPDVDGLEVCRRVREWSQIPIIVISVREHDRDKVAALDFGADDYVTKPFSMDELLARMRANLRRTGRPNDDPLITVGRLSIDLTRRIVTREGNQIHLTPTEYDLLRVLAIHAGRVMTHRQLLREARGPAYEEETPLLRVHMVGLRQKLSIPSGAPGHIVTEPGVGYRLLDQ